MRKRKTMACMVAIGMGVIASFTGCSIDESSSVNEEVGARMEQNQQQAEADAAAAAAAKQEQSPPPTSASSPTPAPSNGSSSSSSSASTGSSGGFVFKPVSEGDGNLVVLLPSTYRGKVSSVTLVKGGSVVATGRYTGDTNGNRPTYRFPQPGAGYGSNLRVVARFKNSTSRTWSIPNGGARVG